MKSFFSWLFDSMARTYTALAILVISVSLASAAATQTTSYDVTNNPQMYLDVSITSTQTTGIKLSALSRNGTTVIFPNMTGGILRLRSGTRVEDLSFTGATVNSSTKVVTLAGVTRNICWNIANSIVSCGNGLSFSKGSIVELNVDARLLNFKANKDRANIFTASGSISFSGSGSFAYPTFATTAARDQALGANPGGPVRTACVTATGLCYKYIGGSWTAEASGTTANAEETVAGKVQLATLAAMQSLNGTGSTGAQNVVPLRWLVKNASGAVSAGRIPTLGSNGLLSQSVIPSQIGAGFFGDGSDGNVTISNATTLSRDMMYNNLTINTGAYINPGGFRIFVAGTLTLYGSTGSIVRNGNAGSNGTAASATTPGSGGASGAVLADSLLMGGIAGSMGGRGGLTVNNGDGAAGVPGNPGRLQGKAVGSNGVAGVAGGAGGQDDDASGAVGSGGGAGAAGSVAAHPASYGSFRFLLPATTNRLNTLTGSIVYYVNAGAGGGGGGGAGSCNGEGSDSAGAGGGGGGSGGNAGIVVVIANMIRGPGSIYAKGGNGGNGGNGGAASSTCGGGGGGASGSGGAGGLVVVVYGDTSWTGSTSVVGGSPGTPGSGGAGGTGAATGSTGSTGNTGTSGISLTFALSQ